MADPNPAPRLLQEGTSLETLRKTAEGCRACHLWEKASQTVFGQGDWGADIMLVGEQPGDQEDKEGVPFVGPAGRLLDRSLEAAGLERQSIYVTNVVKHFKWMPKGKRRIHQKPNAEEVRACKPWLEAEIELVKPKVLVCLGATAAQSLLGRTFKLTEHRGQFVEWPGDPLITATVHPSSILRARDEKSRRLGEEMFVRDLRIVAKQAEK